MSAPDIFEEMRLEAEEWGRRRRIADIQSIRANGKLSARNTPEWERVKKYTSPEALTRRAERRQVDDHEAMGLIQDRDPCFRCGARKDRHDETGCKRWRA
jgi:hypothetical protein